MRIIFLLSALAFFPTVSLANSQFEIFQISRLVERKDGSASNVSATYILNTRTGEVVLEAFCIKNESHRLTLVDPITPDNTSVGRYSFYLTENYRHRLGLKVPSNSAVFVDGDTADRYHITLRRMANETGECAPFLVNFWKNHDALSTYWTDDD